MKRLPLNQFLNVTILVVENSLLTFPGCKTFNGKQIDFLGLKMSTDIVFWRRLHCHFWTFFSTSPPKFPFPSSSDFSLSRLKIYVEYRICQSFVICYMLHLSSPNCLNNSIRVRLVHWINIILGIVIFIIGNRKYCNEIIITIYEFGYYIWKVCKRWWIRKIYIFGNILILKPIICTKK